MRRRRLVVEAESADFPPLLAEFNPDDWWVEDPDAWEQVAYARIFWSLARETYLKGGDWGYYQQPPDWWEHKHRNN